jgi:hypothetical protein
MTDFSPSLLRTYVEPAPTPTDPPGSGEFYAALGIAIVAWGRLEGHFTLTIVTILNIASHKRIGKKLPMKWERLVEVWRTAFELGLVRQTVGSSTHCEVTITTRRCCPGENNARTLELGRAPNVGFYPLGTYSQVKNLGFLRP